MIHDCMYVLSSLDDGTFVDKISVGDMFELPTKRCGIFYMQFAGFRDRYPMFISANASDKSMNLWKVEGFLNKIYRDMPEALQAAIVPMEGKCIWIPGIHDIMFKNRLEVFSEDKNKSRIRRNSNGIPVCWPVEVNEKFKVSYHSVDIDGGISDGTMKMHFLNIVIGITLKRI